MVTKLICEYCGKEIDGLYGSGRFCNKHCAVGYSTKAKRKLINEVVSSKMRGRKTGRRYGYYAPNYWQDLSIAEKEKASKRLKEASKKAARLARERIRAAPWETISWYERKRRLLEELGPKCQGCGNSKWMGMPLVLEMHHIDGNKENNSRVNFQLLCPNCHSLTRNWRRRKETNGLCSS
jgi:hypothetical protein